MDDNQAGRRTQPHEALAVASRLRLLDALRAGDEPMDVRELAAACGLHVTTVRFHLDVLTDAGLVHSRPGRSGGRGRPRRLYTPAGRPAASGGHAGYELLSALLAAHWAGDTDERARRAEEAGWAWGAGRDSGTGPPVVAATRAEAARQVNGVFAELGFDSELAHDGDDAQIRLHTCPFRTVAATYPEVVCSIHLGLLRRVLADMDAPPSDVTLRPFVEPHLCLAEITPTGRTT
ncbi:helix-turn-helix domain-containing protein [Nonomuraea glycinis]|uniref:ArsR family transcriptional regulator n=1 Tax=Nonomuraea glycinis TaxID=2047744 RepID=A0A918ACS4_9ACTN|nr:helix-turn-helix domain-containing protein [Nonomuraea glycinis]MCA2181707.1 helix-turn-helix domain-containing protein [Nonomuraea glycinis]GGP14880.1 ArsR family transcriptional regulator [Nonomuraea glycinis]